MTIKLISVNKVWLPLKKSNKNTIKQTQKNSTDMLLSAIFVYIDLDGWLNVKNSPTVWKDPKTSTVSFLLAISTALFTPSATESALLPCTVKCCCSATCRKVSNNAFPSCPRYPPNVTQCHSSTSGSNGVNTAAASLSFKIPQTAISFPCDWALSAVSFYCVFCVFCGCSFSGKYNGPFTPQPVAKVQNALSNKIESNFFIFQSL